MFRHVIRSASTRLLAFCVRQPTSGRSVIQSSHLHLRFLNRSSAFSSAVVFYSEDTMPDDRFPIVTQPNRSRPGIRPVACAGQKEI